MAAGLWVTHLLVLFVVVHYACGAIRFANSYGNHMVLQRAPKRAIIWGHASKLGDTVTIIMNGVTLGTTQVQRGELGNFVWKFKLAAESSPGPFSITARSSEGEVSMHDVMFGDVWVCSGQSNMQFRMTELKDKDKEIAASLNYTNIRMIMATMKQSLSPLEDVTIQQPWLKPTTGFIDQFSAVCFLFGKQLYNDLQYPIGLIESNWGGTTIEVWSTQSSLDTCSGSNPVIGRDISERARRAFPTGNSVLWNAMIYPFIQSTIFGAIWYQGESNAARPDLYACQFPAMISDWRQRFHKASDGETDSQFPFGFVQLAPWRDTSAVGGFPPLRWAQTAKVGYVPNSKMPNTFMAVAADLPDYSSTSGNIHPRYKQDVAVRLARGARAVAYRETGVDYQGPFPTHFSLDNTNHLLSIQYDNGTANLNVHHITGFDVCCSQSTACSAWTGCQMKSHGSSTIHLDVSVCSAGTHPVAVRYIWRESPCPLKDCPIYDRTSSLPAPPFIHQLS